MPRIRCHYLDCVFLEDGFCGAPAVELDPDEGCMTYNSDPDLLEEDFADDEWEDMGFDEEDDDLWLDEEY